MSSLVAFAKTGGPPSAPAPAQVADSVEYLREFWEAQCSKRDFFDGVRMFLRRHDPEGDAA